MKRRVVVLVLVLMGATVGLSMAQLAEANFNAATGFSGRSGFTCTACHTVPVGPDGDELYEPPARVTLDGLPDAWAPAAEYRLTVTVSGGPPALPNPAPQGGFELEASTGTLAAPSDMVDLVNVYKPGAVTYTVAGTQVRQWAVNWNAPSAATEPTEARFWVAAMAANGNHVIALGAGGGGEFLDSVANLTARVPASSAALEAWQALRLSLPEVDPVGPVAPFTAVHVSGLHTDPDATHIGFRIDERGWASVPTGRSWTLQVDGLGPGLHELWIRSEAGDRQSEAVLVELTMEGSAESTQKAPFPVLVPVLALLLTRRLA